MQLLVLVVYHLMLTPCVSAILVIAQSRHTHTIPLAFATMMKLFHHLAVSSTPSGAILCCPCNLFNSFSNGSCSVYASNLGGTMLAMDLV